MGLALGVTLGQAIGRLGNFINQELYGPPTTLPWGLRIDAAHRIAPYNNLTLYPDSTLFQPLFLYEMIWDADWLSLTPVDRTPFCVEIAHGRYLLALSDLGSTGTLLPGVYAY